MRDGGRGFVCICLYWGGGVIWYGGVILCNVAWFLLRQGQ